MNQDIIIRKELYNQYIYSQSSGKDNIGIQVKLASLLPDTTLTKLANDTFSTMSNNGFQNQVQQQKSMLSKAVGGVSTVANGLMMGNMIPGVNKVTQPITNMIKAVIPKTFNLAGNALKTTSNILTKQPTPKVASWDEDLLDHYQGTLDLFINNVVEKNATDNININVGQNAPQKSHWVRNMFATGAVIGGLGLAGVSGYHLSKNFAPVASATNRATHAAMEAGAINGAANATSEHPGWEALRNTIKGIGGTLKNVGHGIGDALAGYGKSVSGSKIEGTPPPTPKEPNPQPVAKEKPTEQPKQEATATTPQQPTKKPLFPTFTALGNKVSDANNAFWKRAKEAPNYFANKARDILATDVRDIGAINLSAKFHDLKGKIVTSKLRNGNITNEAMNNYSRATTEAQQREHTLHTKPQMQTKIQGKHVTEDNFEAKPVKEKPAEQPTQQQGNKPQQNDNIVYSKGAPIQGLISAPTKESFGANQFNFPDKQIPQQPKNIDKTIENVKTNANVKPSNYSTEIPVQPNRYGGLQQTPQHQQAVQEVAKQNGLPVDPKFNHLTSPNNGDTMFIPQSEIDKSKYTQAYPYTKNVNDMGLKTTDVGEATMKNPVTTNDVKSEANSPIKKSKPAKGIKIVNGEIVPQTTKGASLDWVVDRLLLKYA